MTLTIRQPPRTKQQPSNANHPTGTDTLISPSYLHIVDLLGEGEIEGLVDDGSDASAKLKSIYLDGTPIRNADGTYNYFGIAWGDRNGTNDQTFIPGFSDVEAETAVAAQVVNATPIIRTITDPTVDTAVVTIEIPQLYKVDDTSGDTVANSVEIAIDLQSNGGGYVQQALDGTQIFGKASKAYDKQFTIPLAGSAPWDIRVRRISPDDTDPQKSQSQTWWKSYTSVTEAKMRYPNSALLAIEIPAAQFPTPPARSYLIKGLKVQVPANYDPATRTYVEPWDGTFKLAWTDNPAWCFYDLLTAPRYGLGKFLNAAAVDKWGLYTIGKYCDELVDDGKGGQEPRFTCNLCLQGQEDAYRAVLDFASIFQAMTYWASGAVQVVQDAPADPEYLFTPANVIGGDFVYSGSARRARHNVAIVSWNDRANHCQATREYVEDEANPPSGDNYFPVELAAVGCTSQGQARRLGRRILYTERLQPETVTFKTGLEGALRSPGAIVAIQDPYRSGKRLGGRIVSGTTTEVVLDSDLTIEAGKTYTLNVVLPDGSMAESGISNAPSTWRTLTLTTPLAQAPQADAGWIVIVSDLAPTYWRIIGAAEEEEGTYSITALKYDSTKYAAVEQGLVVQSPPTSIIPSSLAPTGLTVGEALYKSTAGIKVRLNASWDQNPVAQQYAVRWKPDGGNWSNEELVMQHFWEKLDVTPGLYWVQVQAIVSGVRTDAAAASYQVLGKTAPPADVVGFAAAVHPLNATLVWDPVTDLDLDHYEIREDGADWASATLITKIAGTSFVWTPGDAVAHTLRIKAVDTSGNYSTNATSISVTVQNAITTSYIAPNAVTSDRLGLNALQTNNYAESTTVNLLDSNGNPIAGSYAATGGAKLDTNGPAAKVAPGGLYVGQYSIGDAFFRALNALDGTSTAGKAIYKGNNSQGGVPNISRLSMYLDSAVTGTLSWAKYRFVLQPQAATDNLDAIRYIRMDLYGGTVSGGASGWENWELPINDRLYSNATDGNGANAVVASITVFRPSSVNWTGNGSLNPSAFWLVGIYGVYGRSSQLWFPPPATTFATLTGQTAAPYSGGSSGGGGLGGGGLGGACPEENEPLMLADATEIPAGLVQPGMWILAHHHETGELGRWMVQAVRIEWADLIRVRLTDGRMLLDSAGHRFRSLDRNGAWAPNVDLRPGERLAGAAPGVVALVESAGRGRVVKVSIDGAQAFIQRGIDGHNTKTP